MNRLRVIETLYRQPGTSRAELARRTGLSRATVSILVEELARSRRRRGARRRRGRRPRNTGRPPILLSLVPERGVRRRPRLRPPAHPRRRLRPLRQRRSLDDWSPAEVDHAPTESLDLAHELVRGALEPPASTRTALLGVGMGLAAPINSVTGELEADGILPGWHGIRPAAEMEARLGVPVQLENDANVGALGEKVFGAGRGVDDLIYVRLSAGIGAGLDPRRPALPRRTRRRRRDRPRRRRPRRPDLPLRQPRLPRDDREPGRRRGAPRAQHAVATSRSPSCSSSSRAGDRGARRAVADAGEAVGRALAELRQRAQPGARRRRRRARLRRSGAARRRSARRSSATRHAGRRRASASPPATLGDRAEVLGAAALILAQSPHALARRVEQ